jgi:hypothetical protein
VRASVRLALVTTVAALGVAGAVAATASAAPAKPPPVSHQLCYRAKAVGFKPPKTVVLKNQFSPNGFVAKVGPAVAHCNPVKKILPTGKIFPIVNRNAHLVCFVIAEKKQPTPNVVVANQFGNAKLTTGQPNLLCLPTWKSLTGPPDHKPVQPPGLNHFTCYPVKLAPGSAYQPPAVMLQDQFAPKPVPVKVNPVPVELCLPTEKIVGKHDFKIINAAAHLLCFPVSQTPIKPRVFDENQFGTAKVAIGKTTTLCLPSAKKVVH